MNPFSFEERDLQYDASESLQNMSGGATQLESYVETEGDMISRIPRISGSPKRTEQISCPRKFGSVMSCNVSAAIKV